MKKFIAIAVCVVAASSVFAQSKNVKNETQLNSSNWTETKNHLTVGMNVSDVAVETKIAGKNLIVFNIQGDVSEMESITVQKADFSAKVALTTNQQELVVTPGKFTIKLKRKGLEEKIYELEVKNEADKLVTLKIT